MRDGETDAQPVARSGNRADFIFGFGLVLLGLAVTFESWRMPRLAELNVNPMTAPGLVPGMVGIVLFALGAVLFLRAGQASGWRVFRLMRRDPSLGSDPGHQTGRFFVALAICVGYALGLVGTLPFWAATAIFVFIFVFVFEWRRDRAVAGHVRAGVVAMILALIVATIVTFVFEQVFLVRLP